MNEPQILREIQISKETKIMNEPQILKEDHISYWHWNQHTNHVMCLMSHILGSRDFLSSRDLTS